MICGGVAEDPLVDHLYNSLLALFATIPMCLVNVIDGSKITPRSFSSFVSTRSLLTPSFCMLYVQCKLLILVAIMHHSTLADVKTELPPVRPVTKVIKILLQSFTITFFMNSCKYLIIINIFTKPSTDAGRSSMKRRKRIGPRTGADPRMVRIGTAPPPFLTDKSCKFSLF